MQHSKCESLQVQVLVQLMLCFVDANMPKRMYDF